MLSLFKNIGMSSFYSKLVVGLLLSFSVIALVLMLLVQELTQNYQSEVEQKLHIDLAEHIVSDDKLLKDGKLDQTALKHMFHSMMILGPSFEFYVVTPEGLVTTYSADDDKIKRMQVDVTPIKAFLSGQASLPILGDDPRSSFKKKIFSVAPITYQGALQGYLYVIIGGEIYDSIVDLLQESHILKLSFWAGAATLFFSLIVILLLFAMLTKPLRVLASDMNKFRTAGFERGEMPASTWNDNAKDEINRLGVTFQDMAVTLKQQYEKVRTTDELRRELISYVSHDLRTPLASLLGYLETWQLKQDTLSKEESSALIQIAVNNGHHISRLVEQLFELAHLDAENISLKLEPMSITELAYDVMQKLKLSADEKNISLDIEPKDPSIMVMANIEKMERVLTNLLENAIRYSKRGGNVLIKVQPLGKAYQLTVSDQGAGIDPDDLPLIFNPHFRSPIQQQDCSAKGTADISQKRIHSGLGLAITKRILQLHDTEISAESDLDKGASFVFTLKKA
jgi:signal transduction histidine kinase